MAPQDQMIINIICKTHFESQGQDHEQSIHASVGGDNCNALGAIVMGRLGFVKSIASIFTLGFYTAQSDRIGRKCLFYLTFIPIICSYLLVIYLDLTYTKWSIVLLYVNALMMGSLGATELLQPALVAYIALALGVITGPAIGAHVILKTGDNNGSALVVSAGALIVLTFYTALLPESCPKMSIPVDDALKISSAIRPGTPLFLGMTRTFLGRTKTFLADIFNPVLLFLPGRVNPSRDAGIKVVFIPYSNLKYNWDSYKDQIFFTFIGVASFAVYIAVFPALQFIYAGVTAHLQGRGSISVQESRGSSAIPDLPEYTPLLKDVVPNARMTEESVTQVGSNNAGYSIKKDLTFFLIGLLLYAIGNLVIAVFDTEVTLFVGMERCLTEEDRDMFATLFHVQWSVH
ncbi:hypothetical protein BGZ65_008270 [Modicella reniformis]|uniref:Uncharacterized protein n=1 Tax=Modicella reniformis TaxID=1440133 RepID=A0A9P6JGR6_9FUNG|nr:hypothetical protein BGZ65_008270 [Modicella reniformis]